MKRPIFRGMRVDWKVVRAAALIFVGCCTNVITLEALLKYDKGAGNLITFSQFAFVALVGFFGSIDSLSPLRIRQRVITLPYYAAYVAIFWTLSVLNNLALGFNIAMPFHIVFRSGSLVTSLILGSVFLGKRYSVAQVASVIAVTVGIFVATSASVPVIDQLKIGDDVSRFIMGIAMLATALVLSSVLGVFQEHTYAKFGKHLTQEHQFYSHLLSLPFFALMLPDIWSHAMSWGSMAIFELPLVKLRFSAMWLLLAANMLTQWVCISGVFMMTGVAGALTMTLTISLRKFASLILSIVFFNNPFTASHWIAAFLVFTGTLVYSWPRAKPVLKNE